MAFHFQFPPSGRYKHFILRSDVEGRGQTTSEKKTLKQNGCLLQVKGLLEVQTAMPIKAKDSICPSALHMFRLN